MNNPKILFLGLNERQWSTIQNGSPPMVSFNDFVAALANYRNKQASSEVSESDENHTVTKSIMMLPQFMTTLKVDNNIAVLDAAAAKAVCPDLSSEILRAAKSASSAANASFIMMSI